MMNKGLLAISFFLYFAVTTKAQLPFLTLKATSSDIEHSPFYKEFAGKYDLVIAYHYEGGWWSHDEFYYSILAFKGNRRYKITFMRRKYFSDEPLHKPEIKKEIVNKHTADSILLVFKNNNFWALNKDSLNIQGRLYYDTDTQRYQMGNIYISDGTSDCFEVFCKTGHFQMSCYEPEAYFKELPEIKQRGQFINAKRAFLSVFP